MSRDMQKKKAVLSFKGDGFVLYARKPGAGRIETPANQHFLDIYLGKSDAPYVIADLENLGDTSPPSTFVFLPAQSDREITTSRSGWSVQVIFQPSLLMQACSSQAQEEQELGLRAICHAHDEIMVSLVRQISGLWQPEHPQPTDQQIAAVVTLLVMRVDRHIYERDTGSKKRPSNSKRIQVVIDHIESSLNRPHSLDDLAEVAGVSVYHFARMFRQATGRSPHQYVVERRLAFAKRRLTQSDDPIVQIAHDSGFGSQSHMTDVFSKVLGITPGALRRSNS